MASLNRTAFIGNLGKDPETRMAGSAKVTNFSIAVTERFKNKEGQQQEKTEWVNIVVWNRLAEIAEQYLKKGSSIYIEGKLQTRSWDDQEGNKKYMTEIVGSSFQMLGGRQSNEYDQTPNNQEKEDYKSNKNNSQDYQDLPF